jgi:hypothetical protein
MTESEYTVQEYAYRGDGVPQRVCNQLLANQPRYSLWFSQHGRRMITVALRKQRERQIIALRAVALEQIHRTALVKYLRDYQVTGAARAQTLREFYGVLDLQRAAITEHRGYLMAASSQLCTTELLESTADHRGLDLLRRYETMYGHFFNMFCDRARAVQNGTPYLLASLVPEVKVSADRLRLRILSGQLAPSNRFQGGFGGSQD